MLGLLLPFGRPRSLRLVASLRHSRQPIQEQRAEDVEDNIHPENPVVPPPIIVVRQHLREEGVRAGDSAEVASLRRVGVHDLATSDLDIVLEVGLTLHTRGWVEGGHLDVGAVRFGIGEAR